MKNFILIPTIIFFFASCKTNQVSVRLKNISKWNFDEITVKLGDTLKTFKDLKKGESTKVFLTNKTYGYCFTEIIINKTDTVSLYPVDFVGEALFHRGKIILSFDLEQQRDKKPNMIRIKARRRL